MIFSWSRFFFKWPCYLSCSNVFHCFCKSQRKPHDRCRKNLIVPIPHTCTVTD